MAAFTETEREYLRGQRLGRLATVNQRGEPQNAPVGFQLRDDDSIDIIGRALETTKKWRNVLARPAVAFVVDDVAGPGWKPRGVEIRGTALAITDGVERPTIRVTARQVIAWGIETDSYKASNRRLT
jgi:pyridoxamine 5'-phosphate oxidase family protein